MDLGDFVHPTSTLDAMISFYLSQTST